MPSPRILVDADACPVKDEIYEVAYRHVVPVTIVANSWFRVPQHPLIWRIVVDGGFDAADDWIAEQSDPSCVVVTADILLADRCLKAGASVLGPTGRAFTAASIGTAVATRAIMADLRAGAGGDRIGGPAPFAKTDRSRFLSALDEALVRLKRGAKLPRLATRPARANPLAMMPSPFKSRLRAFQAMRGDPPDRGFIADLEFLENRDLDLSVRLGAMLAFDALLMTIGTHPVSASPGAPLSVDAATQPLLTIASFVGIVPIAVSIWFVLRAMLLGEEFDSDGLKGEALRNRLFAAFIRSIDAQARLLGYAIRSSLVGCGLMMIVWAVILSGKMVG